MPWPKKKSTAAMTWQIELLPDDGAQVAAHLSRLVAEGWFVHSIAPRDYADGTSHIYIASCRREKATSKKKPKASDADSE